MTMEIMLDFVIRIGLVVASGFIFSIIFLTYLRMKNRKMLLMSIGFGIFFVNALIHIPELFFEEYKIMLTKNMYLLIYLVGSIFIATGILKD
ncbi:MAG: hypothetical protein P8Y18_03155 [Candidatus Bathyarchaeota archaeon]